MKRADAAIGALLFLVGAYLVYKAGDYAYLVEFAPGPGFLPFWLGIILMVLAGSQLASAILKTEEEKSVTESPSRRVRTLLLFCGLGLGNLLIRYLGFVVLVSLVAFSLMMFMDRKRWRLNIIVTICTGIVLHFIFRELFELSLPMGLLKF